MKKKLISLALAVIMLFGLLPMAAFAEATEPELAELYGDGFLIFGDSYARGMGSTYPDLDEWNALYFMDNVPGEEALRLDTGDMIPTKKECRNIEGSFANLLARAIGCNCPDDITDPTGTFWPVAQNAVTLGAVMDLLGVEDNFFDTQFFHKIDYCRARYDADLYYFGGPYSINADGTGTYDGEAHAMDINTIIKNSKLIVLELGMGDIFNRTYATISNSGMLDDLTDPLAIPNILNSALSLLNEGFKYFETYYPVLINHIREINEDATIVALGAVNTFFGTTISHATLAPIGTAFSALSSKMNSKLKEFSKELDFVYVDISNVETGVTANEMDISDVFADLEIATHPTKGGHVQICNMIIDALKEYNGITEKGAKDIVLDIGRFDDIDCVKVNGIPVCKSDYTVKDHVLTVHCKTKLASSLSITTKLNGKTAVSTYQIVYRDGGYTAYRTYTTNNIFKIPDYWLNTIRSFFANIFK